jgi:hypothetical protein
MQGGTISGSVGNFFQTIDQFSFWQKAVPVFLVGLLLYALRYLVFRSGFWMGDRAAAHAVEATRSPEASSDLAKRRRRALLWCVGLTWLPVPVLGAYVGLTRGNWALFWGTFAILLPPVWFYFMAAVWIGKWLERLFVRTYSVASIVILYWVGVVFASGGVFGLIYMFQHMS